METNYYMDNPELRDYFLSLPAEVQVFLIDSGVEISTLGELMQVGEHLKTGF